MENVESLENELDERKARLSSAIERYEGLINPVTRLIGGFAIFYRDCAVGRTVTKIEKVTGTPIPLHRLPVHFDGREDAQGWPKGLVEQWRSEDKLADPDSKSE